MPKVLKLRNENQLDKLLCLNDNRALIPVIDGNGDLIVGLEVLTDPAFVDIRDDIIQFTDEIDYVSLPEDEQALQLKLEEFELNGKLIRITKRDEVEYKGVKIKIKDIKDPRPDNQEVKEEKEEKEVKIKIEPSITFTEKVLSYGKNAINWFTNLFK